MNKCCFSMSIFVKVNLAFPDLRNSLIPGLSMVSFFCGFWREAILSSPHFLAYRYKIRTTINSSICRSFQCLANPKPDKFWWHPIIWSCYIKKNWKQGHFKILPFTTHWDSILKCSNGLFFPCLKVLCTILSLSSCFYDVSSLMEQLVSDKLPSYPGKM